MEEIKEIKRKIYELYGWSIREWAKRRGFSPQVVYFALRGDRKRAGGKRMREIWEVLEEDLTGGLMQKGLNYEVQRMQK